MSENIIEVGEDVEIDVVVDEDGNVVAAVIDDVVVATGAEGSIVDETIEEKCRESHQSSVLWCYLNYAKH